MSEEIPKKRGLFGRLFRRGGGEAVEPPEPPSEPDEEPTSGEEADAPAPEPPADQEPSPEEEPLPEPEEVGEAPPPEPADAPPEPVPEEEREGEAEEGSGEDSPARAGFLARLRQGLAKTRQGLAKKVDRVLFGKKEIDAETLDELEEALVTADLGVATVMHLVDEIREKVSRKELVRPEALREHLKAAIREILVAEEARPAPEGVRPWVIMVVGVNGVGKTTTIGKIGARFRREGKRVILAAGDTFRAAAIEQLEIWGNRIGAQVVRHQQGSDPAAVAFDAVEAGKARDADVVIVDTAGRLHTKRNLMEELKKVRRVIGKALPGAPHEVLLVLDATTGQNAVSQARLFHEAVGVDAIALTKLDGTARGGVIVAICDDLKIPIRYIGIGEGVEDLRPFDAQAFVDALF
ncbi:signal recognition particle-docking protein FtsY [Deferrisoma camini]|uniref:signal recognition particle-docking protein FtsY n=1 Tax=Deferrisoma camini TaxID=1035120 RepID=UPI00046CBA89|nr:signal recognition particle-docking protein FtsY [Deferrisoma camini]